LFIDVDKGMQSIVGTMPPSFEVQRYDASAPAATLFSYRDVRDIISNLAYQNGPYWNLLVEADYIPQTIVLDSLSALCDVLEAEVVAFPPDGKSRDEALQIQDYNTIQRRIYGILDLAKAMKMHWVVISGIDYSKDHLQVVREHPAVTGEKLGPRIPHFFDDVFTLSKSLNKEGSVDYIISNKPTRTWEHSGTRWALPQGEWTNATFDTFAKYYQGEQ
jgi:hypothetical protein